MGHIEASKGAIPQHLTHSGPSVSDPQTWDKWFTIHEKWMQEPPAILTTGATLVAKIVMLGMANKMEWVVGEVDAPRSLALAGTGMASWGEV